MPIDNVLLLHDQWSSTHKHQDKGDNHLIRVDNFTAFSILTRFSAFYHHFVHMKVGLRGKHYASGEELKTAMMKWLKEQSTEFYEAGTHALI